MVSELNLTDSGVQKFNAWFEAHARDGVHIDAIVGEVCGIMIERVMAGESLVYELDKQYTSTGRPELLHFEQSDIEVTEESDE